jgi:hypothetical protein
MEGMVVAVVIDSVKIGMVEMMICTTAIVADDWSMLTKGRTVYATPAVAVEVEDLEVGHMVEMMQPTAMMVEEEDLMIVMIVTSLLIVDKEDATIAIIVIVEFVDGAGLMVLNMADQGQGTMIAIKNVMNMMGIIMELMELMDRIIEVVDTLKEECRAIVEKEKNTCDNFLRI